MTNNIFYEKLTNERDIAPLLELRQRSRFNNYKTFIPNLKQVDFELSKENIIQKKTNIIKLLQSEKEFWFIAKDKEKIVGFTRASKESHGSIKALFVEPQYQSLGIGTELMKHALEWLKDEQIISLKVLADNTKTIKFYKKFGFIETQDNDLFKLNNIFVNRIRMIRNNSNKMLILYLKTKVKDKSLQLKELIQERIGTDYKVEILGLAQFEIEIQLNEKGLLTFINGNDIKEYKLIYTKQHKEYELATILAQIAKYNGIKLINEVELFSFSMSKLLQKVCFATNNLDVPYFYFNSNFLNKTYEEIKEKVGEKFVAKQTKSSMGLKVKLIENENDFNKFKLELVESKDSSLWYFDEYIPHEFTTRGIVSGDNCEVKIKVLKESDSFRTNRGNTTFSTEVEKELADACIKAAHIMHLDIAGVDTVKDSKDGKIKIFEINKDLGLTTKPVSPEIDAISSYLLTLLK